MLRKMGVVLCVVLLVCGVSFAGDKCVGENACTKSHEVAEEPALEGGVCPITNVDMGCYLCHYRGSDFKSVKKTSFVEYLEPIPVVSDRFEVLKDGDLLYSYWCLRGISDSTPEEFLDIYQHAKKHGIGKIVIELQSYGGSLLEAWRTIGIMDMAKADGITIETRCHGYAMSAGTLIFVNGSDGHRYVSETSLFMFHELSQIVVKRATPASSEDEARLFRMIQDRLNEFLEKYTKISKEEWDKHVWKNEFWCNGAEAVKFGIADKMMGE